MSDLKRTSLYDLHVERGGKMVSFAGWEMPVQFKPGVMQEHLHTRAAAGLFDVSHMGQVILHGADAAGALEALVPADIVGLPAGRQRYGFFTNAQGGILDDLMIANHGECLVLVVNAANAGADIAHLKAALGDRVEPLTSRALIALQGPEAETAFAALVPDAADMRFMDVRRFATDFGELWVSRSGYTGEDGFEISVPEAHARPLAEALLSDPRVAPIGLGARDSLRLEAGLPITPETTPLEAGLGWAIGKARREGPRAGGYPGAETIAKTRESGPARKLVGLLPEGRAPMRAHTPLFDSETGGTQIGTITSGGFAPSLGAPVAMGYLPAALSGIDTRIWGEVRGKRLPARVASTPFHKPNYKR